jgi:hypothetical protein
MRKRSQASNKPTKTEEWKLMCGRARRIENDRHGCFEKRDYSDLNFGRRVDDQTGFKTQNPSSMAQDLDSSRDDTEMNEQFVFFWRTGSPYSQWHPCTFSADGHVYSSAEQYMMAHKAKLFGDHDGML